MAARRTGRALLHSLAAFWRNLTAPAWLPAWERLCAETGAELLPPAPWRAGSVRARHHSYTIELSSWVGEDGPGTALRTELSNATGFAFAIRRRGSLDGLRGVFGGPPFHTGCLDFDEAFRVAGSSDDELGRLLSGASLRDSIARQSEISLSLAEKPVHRTGRLTQRSGAGVSTLVLETSEAVADPGRLRSLFDLHRQVLDALSEIGVASAVGTSVAEPGAAADTGRM